ncbi:uncharacterized protein LOC128470899 [Spea bombifrons]|uniref:uncharacterized protein LOC128470899 n=1 Tax=Spea bombifrons TaxID=233779 RepID=UPI00234A4B9E|nr:uncharacterized protein LOC128470899 [Spea bombifrons]
MRSVGSGDGRINREPRLSIRLEIPLSRRKRLEGGIWVKGKKMRVTMYHTAPWRVLFLLSLIAVIYCQSCKWLRPQQEYLNKMILQNFKMMHHVEGSHDECINSSPTLPNTESLFNISQVEEAAIAVREFTNRTIWFYGKQHERLHCQENIWKRLQDLLHYLGSQVADCVPTKVENPTIKQQISEYFSILDKTVSEQDNSCTRSFVQFNIKRNLQLAMQLSSRMRRRHLLNESHVVS